MINYIKKLTSRAVVVKKPDKISRIKKFELFLYLLIKV